MNTLVAVSLLTCEIATGSGGAVPLEALKLWTIVVAADAIPSEQYAAEECRDLFRQALGVELELSKDTSRKTNVVLIGPGAAGTIPENTGEEELRIEIRKGRITISGGRPRGTLYGVYEFFERYFGCEFLTYDQTWFPPPSKLKALPVETYSYTPPFSFRWSYYKENTDHPEFATRLRVNTVANDARLGGKTPQSLIGHSYYKWINPEKYGQTHPEYFALVDGVRRVDGAGGGPQPCVSNPDVIEIITKGVLDELAQNSSTRNIAVSQNDNGAYCQCPRCEEINTREGTPMGANLTLVNAVAERVAKEYPGVMVGTLAYWYTRKPPNALKPRENVQIQLCSIECCSLHPINAPECPINRAFCEDLAGWRALCNEIWIWNYNTNFSYYDLPFPNLKSIGPNVQLFLDSHAKGVFMQANGNGNTGEFCDLRNYVMAKCLWKPGQDSWELSKRFCRLHYGGAANDIIEYLGMIHRVSEKAGFHPDCGPTPERIGLTPEVCRDAMGCFAQAMQHAEDETVRARVEKASISVYKATLLAGETSWQYDDGLVRRVMCGESEGVWDRYMELCRKYNMTMHNEGTPSSDFAEKFRLGATVPAVQIENSIWRIVATPGHNGAIVGLYHKPSGRELLRAMQNLNIDKGILETYVETGNYRRTQQLECTAEATSDTIRMTKTLPGGTKEERTVCLDNEQPELVRVGFAINQGGANEQSWRFISQTGFHPGTRTKNADQLSVYVRSNGWKVVNRGWIVDKGPDAEVVRTAKEGQIAFFNHKSKFGALIACPPQEVGEFCFYWHPERPQLNLEVRTPKATLKPGESLKLGYMIRYLDKPVK